MFINKNFTFLFFSTLISGIGTGLTALGIAWVIQQLYDDFNALALLNTIGMIFAFLVLPKFSLWVDKYSKIDIAKILFFIGFIFQVIFFGINHFIGEKIWLLVLVGVVSSILGTLEPVNRIAIAKSITSKDQYASTTRLLELMQQLMTFIAGFLGVLLVKKTQISFLLIVGAISFLIAFFLLYFINIEDNQPNAICAAKKNTQNISLASLPKMTSTFYIFGAITLIPYVCIMAQRVIYPGHFENILHATSMQYSLYTLPYALGAIVAIGSIRYLNNNINQYLSIFLGILLYAISVISILVWPTLYVTYAALFVFSICHCTIRINRLELMMHIVPMEYFGRINGKFQSFSTLIIIILSWLPAFIMNGYGIRAGWLVYALISIMPIIVYLYYLKSIKILTISASDEKSVLSIA